jgi:hypothetical protein
MVLRKLIVYSIVSPSFGLALLTVFVAVNLPSFTRGVITAEYPSITDTKERSIRFKVIVNEEVKAGETILNKAKVDDTVNPPEEPEVPLVSFKLIGWGSSPTLVRLSLTYVSPLGSWSVITTLFRTPFSMVLRKLIDDTVNPPEEPEVPVVPEAKEGKLTATKTVNNAKPKLGETIEYTIS